MRTYIYISYTSFQKNGRWYTYSMCRKTLYIAHTRVYEYAKWVGNRRRVDRRLLFFINFFFFSAVYIIGYIRNVLRVVCAILFSERF